MSIKMENKTQIIAQQGRQDLFIHRVFAAPIEKVFQAFSRPEILIRFFAPKGVKMEFLTAEYQQGSFYRYRHTDAHGKILCTFKGVIHEMSAPDRIIITSELEEMPQPGHVVLEIYEFSKLDNNKTKLIIQDVCRSIDDREALINSGMEASLVSIFTNLDELLRSGL